MIIFVNQSRQLLLVRCTKLLLIHVPQNIGGLYSAEYNMCFLMGGIDERIASPEDLKRELDAMTVQKAVSRV